MSKFQGAMRRVITGDNAQGQSVVIIDGGPSSEKGNPDLGEMFEIWEDAAFGPLTPSAKEDLGATRPVLGPRKGNFQLRWFVIHPQPDSVTTPQADPSMRERFAEFYGAGHIMDQTLHPGMHETHSIDIICLLQGEASLILESGETRLRPGNVVIQRGMIAQQNLVFFLPPPSERIRISGWRGVLSQNLILKSSSDLQ